MERQPTMGKHGQIANKHSPAAQRMDKTENLPAWCVLSQEYSPSPSERTQPQEGKRLMDLTQINNIKREESE